jgi:hypothetical protein
MPKYNRETEAAIQETRDILSGRVSAKSYGSVQELFDELEETCADPETGFVVKKQPQQEAKQ